MKERLERLYSVIEEEDLSGCVISKPENIYYFTGVYPVETSFLIVPSGKDPLLLAAPSSYREAVDKAVVEVGLGELNMLVSLKRVLLSLGCLPPRNDIFLRNLLGNWRSKPLGIEGDRLGVSFLDALGNPKYRDISSWIMDLRMVKDGGEIKCIERAVKISEDALRESLGHLRVGARVRELSGFFDHCAKRRGADETKARVRAGRNTAFPFSRDMGGRISRGPVLIDFGCAYRGYWCDLTRMFYVGEPDEAFADAYEAVVMAREKGLMAAVAGERIAKTDVEVRSVLVRHGYRENLVYTSGHGVGLEVHEPPIISSQRIEPSVPRLYSDGDPQRLYRVMRSYLERAGEPRFRENTVIALEPGVYLKRFGVRVEDMVLVKRKPRLLSSLSARLEDSII